MLPAFLPVRASCTQLHDVNQQAMRAASTRARRIADRAIWSMGAIGLAAVGFGLIFSLVLSNRMVRPLMGMRTAARDIAEGNYDVEVTATASDELGDLARQFNDMAARLRAYRDLNVERIMAEKRKSEAIIQSIDDGLVLIDADLAIQDLNPAAADALDLNVSDVIGRHFLEVVKSDRLFRYVRETAESGTSPALDEADMFFTVEHGDEQHHYQFSVTPVYGTSETLLGVILLLRDVTQLKELDRLKSEFVATASHELRTPLTSINMSISLLKERTADKLDAREQELLDVAQEDVERLRELVSDLLDLSKIEAGRIDLDFAAVPVSLLFDKTLQSIGPQAEEQSIMLDAEPADDLPDVRADATKITWVLTNLISNALRYTEAGGRITLAAQQVGKQVHLSVSDTGEGIPYEYQSKIFDKFVQVKSDHAVGGSGLGLSICREIVRAHGGSIWVDSTPGEGSTFTFSLPAIP